MHLFILLFICAFAYLLIQNVARFVQNENAPLLTQAATLVEKRRVNHRDANNITQTSYTAAFLLAEDQRELRCTLPRRVYNDLEEGAHGLLTHQGTRFQRFEWDGRTVEK